MTMLYPNLRKYGLTDSFVREAAAYDGLFLARVTAQHRGLYTAVSETGEINAAVSGKFSWRAEGPLSFPAVGDWVLLDREDAKGGNAAIQHILRRKSVFTRKAAGAAHEGQVIATNIDTLFICMSLNANFNLRRAERYLAIVWESRAAPVIVLTKSDLCEDLESKVREVASVALGADVAVCSSKNAQGWDAVRAYLQPGKTAAFIGSSGVGKSTLINRLAGMEIMATKEIRASDDEGRHATTHRQLILLPDGGLVMDTPGMRELALYTGDIAKTFQDIEELALGCKYKDCSHTAEPGCAVLLAIEEGMLSEKRFMNYQKLHREVSYEGMNSRQIEDEKIRKMFGSKADMQRFRKFVKEKRDR